MLIVMCWLTVCGYACGRFAEIYNEITGATGIKYNTLCCNAENFIERAKAAGLEVGTTPKPGAIICWQKGATLGSSDGAGHVAIVEQVIDNNHIYTSESGWGSNAFWNQHRYNTNGRWGCNANYQFRGFIYNPVVQEIVEVAPEPEIVAGPSSAFNIGDKVVINGPLYKNSNATEAVSSVSNKVTNITRKAVGARHPYNTTGDLGWMDESSIIRYVEPAPAPVQIGLRVGDTVKIIASGNGSSSGKAGRAGGIGWTRQVLAILTGKPYPIKVGNKSGVTGYYKESALQKK